MKSPVDVVPGELQAKEGHLVLNAGRKTAVLDVVSVCDRPIQVGVCRGSEMYRLGRGRASIFQNACCLRTLDPKMRKSSQNLRQCILQI